MISWTFKTSRRRMTKHFGAIDGYVVYSIIAEKIGGPWALIGFGDSDYGTFQTIGDAKRFAEECEAKNSNVSASN